MPFFSALVAIAPTESAFAQRARSGAPMPNKSELGSAGERANANTIAIVSGNLNAPYLSIAYDLSAVLDDGDEFRVLPVVGKGGGQNIKDVRFLKGVDLGITQSVLLNGYRESNEIGPIDDKIVYLAKLFNEEMHLIVRAERAELAKLKVIGFVHDHAQAKLWYTKAVANGSAEAVRRLQQLAQRAD